MEATVWTGVGAGGKRQPGAEVSPASSRALPERRQQMNHTARTIGGRGMWKQCYWRGMGTDWVAAVSPAAVQAMAGRRQAGTLGGVVSWGWFRYLVRGG